jgi:hypothetical protein
VKPPVESPSKFEKESDPADNRVLPRIEDHGTVSDEVEFGGIVVPPSFAKWEEDWRKQSSLNSHGSLEDLERFCQRPGVSLLTGASQKISW